MKTLRDRLMAFDAVDDHDLDVDVLDDESTLSEILEAAGNLAIDAEDQADECHERAENANSLVAEVQELLKKYGDVRLGTSVKE